jgi:hypothetical protein
VAWDGSRNRSNCLLIAGEVLGLVVSRDTIAYEVYIVAASCDGRTEIWAIAATLERAVPEVLRRLSPGGR